MPAEPVHGSEPVRPRWAIKPYWDDSGNHHDEVSHGTVCLYVYQRPSPDGGPFYGGICGGWFDRIFTDDPQRVTCGRCLEEMEVRRAG